MEKNNNKRANERNGSVVILRPAGYQFPMVKKKQRNLHLTIFCLKGIQLSISSDLLPFFKEIMCETCVWYTNKEHKTRPAVI